MISRPEPRPVFSPILWWALGALHALLIVVGLDSEPLLAATATASAVFFAFARFAVMTGNLFSFSWPLMFVGFVTFSYAYMNYVFVTFTELPRGAYHDLTSWLAALMSVGAAVGALTVHALIGRDPLPPTATPLVHRWQTLVVFGSIFIVILFGHLATGFLNARWEGAGSSTGATYLVTGVGPIGFAFFFLLGTRLTRPLFAMRNLLILVGVGIIGVLQGLSGGRGFSLFMALLTLWGAAWGQLTRRQLWVLWSVTFAFGIVFAIVVQETRGRTGFAFGSAETRAELMLETAGDVRVRLSDDDSVFEPLIARLFEFSVQVVIDQTVRTQYFAGFEYFDRLRYLFLPKFLAPDKLPVSNGKEILERDFGYRLGDYTSVPVTLLGDAYRRGGEIWVFITGLLMGAWLRILVRLTWKIIGPDLCLVCLALFSMMMIGLAGESVTGAISVVTYHWSKQVVVFLVAVSILKALIAFTSPSTPAQVAASPLHESATE